MKANIRIGDVCEILNGFAFKSDEYVEDGIRVMRITNVQKGAVVDDEPKYFPAERASEISRFLLQEGDLLMSLTGNVGRVGLLQKELLPAALNQRVACLRLKDDRVLMKYLFYILNSDSFEADCIFNASGIAQKNMSTRWLESYEMPVPPISEQERIIAKLDLLTSIIDKQKQQLAKLDTLAQSIFYDMFGNPVENERKWEITALNDVCSDITDGSHNPPKGGCKSAFMMLSSKNIFDGYYTIEEPRYLSKEEFATENKRTNLKCGDILLTIVGTIGRCCVFDGANQVALQRSVAVLKPKKSLVSIFLMKQLQALRAVLENEAKGVAQKGIYLNQLKRLNVILPPTSLQQSFAEKIAAIEQQKDTINRSIEESQKLFDYTMDKYFG